MRTAARSLWRVGKLEGISWLIQNMLGECLIWPASTLESSGNIWKVLLAKWTCAAPSLVCHPCNLTLDKQRKKQRKELKRKQVTKRLKKRRKWTKEEKQEEGTTQEEGNQ